MSKFSLNISENPAQDAVLLEKLLSDVKLCWVGCEDSIRLLGVVMVLTGASIGAAFTPLLSFSLKNISFDIITYKRKHRKEKQNKQIKPTVQTMLTQLRAWKALTLQ